MIREKIKRFIGSKIRSWRLYRIGRACKKYEKAYFRSTHRYNVAISLAERFDKKYDADLLRRKNGGD
jgi:hypothetical protein